MVKNAPEIRNVVVNDTAGFGVYWTWLWSVVLARSPNFHFLICNMEKIPPSLWEFWWD